MKEFIVTILVVLLLGCSSAPKLTSQPVEVSIENLSEFWLPKNDTFSFDSESVDPNRPKGYVKIRHLIDSNGMVFKPEVVESVPLGVWDDQGLKAVQEMAFVPSDSNAAKTPVYVVREVHFKITVTNRHEN